MKKSFSLIFVLSSFIVFFGLSSFGDEASRLTAGMHCVDSTDSIANIDVQAVYYIASDASPLSDWRERVEYHLKRAQKFHEREFAGQSTFHYTLMAQPFIASVTSGEFPKDDVNNFYWHIINEVWQSGKVLFSNKGFPILLVFSDMNYSPGYSDWTRECSGEGCLFPAPHSGCNGWVTGEGEDRPGSRCGGARSVYWKERQIGLGLVTADGWRVPILGTDCVTYHEGIGHAIGLPHPEPLNDSVMGLAQYAGSMEKTWVDDDQKKSLGWQPKDVDKSTLFSQFHIGHSPSRPLENLPVMVAATFPNHIKVKSIVAEYQDALEKPFQPLQKFRTAGDTHTVTVEWKTPPLAKGESLAFRVRLVTEDGKTEEIWNYLKVR